MSETPSQLMIAAEVALWLRMKALHRLCVGRNGKNPECQDEWNGPVRSH